ncbi:MAG TPA: aminotransferase class V-fold PLP-dependent enzyme [Bacteroidetes bacterium]|nr:aminotransferase class V-fold PLP-dependent enzyme [Bacteroidota bacterium]
MLNIEELRRQVVGVDEEVPTLGGARRPYINFDNAASTPVLKPVLEGVNDFMRWYASVHRGTGFKSKLSTLAYETAREKVLDFVGADCDRRVAIFVRNTTEAVNKLAHRLGLNKGDIVLTTLLEHHSNDLPWRRVADVRRLPTTPEGRPELDALDSLLLELGNRVKLVAVTGASNVTGLLTPIHDVARVAHRHGVPVFVDAAQLAPHRKITLEGDGRPDTYIDYLGFSAHKMYAPFGSGALVGWRELFEDGEPTEVGGGTIRIVTLEEVVWASPPENEEAGSPNVPGAVALGLAIDWFQRAGMEAIEEHEHELSTYAWNRMQEVPGVELYGPPFSEKDRDRLGVFVFNLEGWHHAKLAAILGYEFGIGVRNGCFCAHPYVKHLLDITGEKERELVEKVSRGDWTDVPGAVRVSFGFYNTTDEIDAFVEALQAIRAGQCESESYKLIRKTGEYIPEPDVDFAKFLPRLA